MKPTTFLIVAVAAAALAGCAGKPHAYPIRSLADQEDDKSTPHLPVEPATADHSKPKPVPLAGVLVQVPNSQVVKGVEDVVVHARRVQNDNGSGIDQGLGFTALISTCDADRPVRPPPHRRTPFQVGLKTSEVKIAMPYGMGIFRGLRPRLTTAVMAIGSESSTIITWATDRYQWAALIQYTPKPGEKPGYVTLLSPTGAELETKYFPDALTVIVAEVYAEDDLGKPLWRLVDADKIADDATIDAVCREAWKRAQAGKVIPDTEPYPG